MRSKKNTGKHESVNVWQYIITTLPLRMLFSGHICFYSMLVPINVYPIFERFHTLKHFMVFLWFVYLLFFLPKSILHFQNYFVILISIWMTAPVIMQKGKLTKFSITDKYDTWVHSSGWLIGMHENHSIEVENKLSVMGFCFSICRDCGTNA